MEFTPGKAITVAVKRPGYLYEPLYGKEAAADTYTGIIQQSQPYDGQDTFRMTGGRDVPTRVVSLRLVTSIDGAPYSHGVDPANKPRAFKVAGSKGAEYLVTCDRTGRFACPCPGFKYHGKCSHIDKVRGFLNKEHNK